MASKTGKTALSDKQRTTSHSPAAKEDLGKSFSSQTSFSSKTKLGVEEQFAESLQITAKQVKEGDLEGDKLHPANSSSAGIHKSSRATNSPLDEFVDSLDVSFDQEKKTSDYASVKDSFVSSKTSDGNSSLGKTSGSAKTSDRADFVESSSKSSLYRDSTSTDVSDESSCSSFTSTISKPHKANDIRWEAIQVVRSKDCSLGLSHCRLLKRLGCGDIGSVYLSELNGTKCYFAMKVMDKVSLASRKKLIRAQTEREILQSLDHPFLPTLYSHFETEKFACLMMEFCPGVDLHTLRQRQPGKHFSEQVVKFYVAEILLAIEYLHMLGIVYRDLKPENVIRF